MTALDKVQIGNLERRTGVKIEQTDVTHIIRAHTEGCNTGFITTLEQSEDLKWFIQTIKGDLVQLKKTQKI